ncbi:hypothetical protein GCM10010301_73510 [Streptomyces plicatus]|nr:hypothetical protein GCM10010301_73510 [Streptomyces plicatus]
MGMDHSRNKYDDGQPRGNKTWYDDGQPRGNKTWYDEQIYNSHMAHI